MDDDQIGSVGTANDFDRVRLRARLKDVFGALSGASTQLMSYEDVRRRLRAVESASKELREIPLDAIVGSVGRYQDFTREFLPRQDAGKDRWVRVKRAMTGMQGVPPIEVYQIGDAYFVKDGNHRVSVARELGFETIHGYVTPVRTRVPLSPEDSPDDLIIKSEYVSFLEETGLDEIRPDADLTVTVPGQYEQLLEHIHVHRYFMGIDCNHPIPWSDAVGHWYDHVYLPVVRVIRSTGLLADFDGRTETDLYLWLSEHRGRLKDELGWSLSPETIAEGMVESPRLSQDQRDEVLGQVARHEPGAVNLADDILVALADADEGLKALDQALVVARRESATLYGLHVVETEEATASPEAAAVREAFMSRCRDAGVKHQFAIVVGDVVSRILERAAWVDVVVAHLVYGTDEQTRLSSKYRSLLRRCPRPLLAVPDQHTELSKILLAYDGSARSEEALFAAAYTCAKWGTGLVVLTVSELGRSASATIKQAMAYLERYDLEATYVEERGPVLEAIIETIEAHGCDAVFMGSYSYSRWLESMFGGVLEGVLTESGKPVLIM